MKQWRILVQRSVTSLVALSMLVFVSALPSVHALETTGSRGIQEPTGRVQTEELTGVTQTSEASAAEAESDRGIQGDIGPGSLDTTTPPAEASSTTLINEQTGNDSTNQNSVSTSNDVDADVTNDASIDNTANLDLNTGSNDITNNTRVGDIKTGDIEGSLTFINAANSTFAEGSGVGMETVEGSSTNEILLSPLLQRQSLINTGTGNDSTNNNIVDGTNVVQLLNENTATIDNTVAVLANTGLNNVEDNTSVRSFESGDIELLLSFLNLANYHAPNTLLAVDVWSVLGDFDGDFVIPSELVNSETGNDSANQNTATQTNRTSITTTNIAETENNFAVQTNTGGNTIADNTSVGDVTTGNTFVDGVVTTVSNIVQPVLYVFNVFGDWMGELFTPDNGAVIVNQMGNSRTGEDSVNNNISTQTNDTSITQVNDARVRNNIAVQANTGNNSLQRNTEVGSIKTGDISIFGNVVNVLNSVGTSLDNFRISIVNIFGNWNGGVRSAPKTATPSNPESTDTQAASNTEASAPSSVNGVGGHNESSNVPVSETVTVSLPQPKLPTWPRLSFQSKTTATQETSDSDTENSISKMIALASDASDAEGEGNDVLVKGYQRTTPTSAGLYLPRQAWYMVGGLLLLVALWGYLEFVTAQRRKKNHEA